MGKDVSPRTVGEAIATIIAKLCYRSADELGESLGEKTSQWRQKQVLAILQKADEKYTKYSLTQKEIAHPRLVHHILDEGSWNENDHIQEMWAGLLASSCTESGDDDSNLIFVNILRQLTGIEAKIINFACESCEKDVTKGGWLASGQVIIELNELVKISGEEDLHRLDRELDHLRSLELIQEGFDPNNTSANITPSALALQMYVRSQGYIGSPIDYFGLKYVDENAP